MSLDNLALGAYEAMEANEAFERANRQYDKLRDAFIEEHMDEWYTGKDRFCLSGEMSVSLACEAVARAAKDARASNDEFMLALFDANQSLEDALKFELGAFYDRRSH